MVINDGVVRTLEIKITKKLYTTCGKGYIVARIQRKMW